ncbi:hypothetical protein J6590_043622 [Homalodisca vitripennis]|nr:hypothetical protein J6590_043622 [Homalodisca vitripennis]
MCPQNKKWCKQFVETAAVTCTSRRRPVSQSLSINCTNPYKNSPKPFSNIFKIRSPKRIDYIGDWVSPEIAAGTISIPVAHQTAISVFNNGHTLIMTKHPRFRGLQSSVAIITACAHAQPRVPF